MRSGLCSVRSGRRYEVCVQFAEGGDMRSGLCSQREEI